ncbi:MAG: hypothetical protein NUW37_05655 [Planctomycetes bacterium]|nr:hypothetical protein [Planctomycetota bacterium]
MNQVEMRSRFTPVGFVVTLAFSILLGGCFVWQSPKGVGIPDYRARVTGYDPQTDEPAKIESIAPTYSPAIMPNISSNTLGNNAFYAPPWVAMTLENGIARPSEDDPALGPITITSVGRSQTDARLSAAIDFVSVRGGWCLGMLYDGSLTHTDVKRRDGSAFERDIRFVFFLPKEAIEAAYYQLAPKIAWNFDGQSFVQYELDQESASKIEAASSARGAALCAVTFRTTIKGGAHSPWQVGMIWDYAGETPSIPYAQILFQSYGEQVNVAESSAARSATRAVRFGMANFKAQNYSLNVISDRESDAPFRQAPERGLYTTKIFPVPGFRRVSLMMLQGALVSEAAVYDIDRVQSIDKFFQTGEGISTAAFRVYTQRQERGISAVLSGLSSIEAEHSVFKTVKARPQLAGVIQTCVPSMISKEASHQRSMLDRGWDDVWKNFE